MDDKRLESFYSRPKVKLGHHFHTDMVEGPVIKSTHLPLFESFEAPAQQADNGVQTITEMVISKKR